MKNIIFTVLFICALNYSCSDFLDIVPDNIPTIDHSFNDRVGAERFLATCYAQLPNFGHPSTDVTILGSDEFWMHESDIFYGGYAKYAVNVKKNMQNVNSPIYNFWASGNGATKLWNPIRDCNIFLEKIDQVGTELSEYEKEAWKAEAKFLKAYYHYYLLRLYGPIPLIKENLPISASIEESRTFREPFEDCVNYIVELIDEAVPALPLAVNSRATELGRITQPIALAIKAELLVMAASPLFNGNPDHANVADKLGRKIFADYDKEKWGKAMIACKNAIDTSLLAGHAFYSFDYPYKLSDTTKLIMDLRHVVTDKYNDELIWANSRITTTLLELCVMPFFSPLYQSASGVNSNLAPTLDIAELFYTNNGVPIEEDKTFHFADRYNLTIAPPDHKYYVQTGFQTPHLHLNREPRFYSSLGFDGGIWWGNGRFKDVGEGEIDEQPWVLRMKRGEFAGNWSNLKYSLTGYYPKKLLHFETIHNAAGGHPIHTRWTWPIIRLSSLYLLYAEAMNEYYDQPTSEVYEYVDIIREKAGLKGVKESWANYSSNPAKPDTKDGMRKIIQQERLIELAFEGERFWDLRRWKLSHVYYNKAIRGWNSEGAGIDFYLPKVYWTLSYSTKNYLWPISETTLRSDPSLVQNPYW